MKQVEIRKRAFLTRVEGAGARNCSRLTTRRYFPTEETVNAAYDTAKAWLEQ